MVPQQEAKMVRHQNPERVAAQVRRFDRLGYAAGILTLLFLMGVAVLPSLTHRDIRCSARFPIVAALALGAALAAGAIGGSASAKGSLPIPGLEDRDPIVIATGGGIAVLLIVMLLGYQMYVRNCKDDAPPPAPVEPEIIIAVPEGATLARTIAVFEKTTNVNVITTSCSADLLNQSVQSGEIRANSEKAWLELLSHRVRTKSFTVQEMKERVQYAITCP